jgi:hypothetical protein
MLLTVKAIGYVDMSQAQLTRRSLIQLLVKQIILLRLHAVVAIYHSMIYPFQTEVLNIIVNVVNARPAGHGGGIGIGHGNNFTFPNGSVSSRESTHE